MTKVDKWTQLNEISETEEEIQATLKDKEYLFKSEERSEFPDPDLIEEQNKEWDSYLQQVLQDIY